MLVHLTTWACVLHNFCLLNDDYDENYYWDTDDGDHGVADNGLAVGYLGEGALAAEAKLVQLINIICENKSDFLSGLIVVETTLHQCELLNNEETEANNSKNYTNPTYLKFILSCLINYF